MSNKYSVGKKDEGLRYAILISLTVAALSKGADTLALLLARIIPLSNAYASAVALLIIVIPLALLLISYIKK